MQWRKKIIHVYKLLNHVRLFGELMYYSSPSFSVHGILHVRILVWVAIHFSKGSFFPTQELNLGLLHCRQILYHLSHQGSLKR